MIMSKETKETVNMEGNIEEKEFKKPHKKNKEKHAEIIKDLEDKLLRSQAELINYKKRKDEETSRTIKYANEELIQKILPTLDNFERAIALDDNDLTDELSKFLEGFKLIYTSFVKVLNDMGLKEIEALEKPFDPTYHQAVMTDKEETKEDGIVLEVYQKGYMLNDRVIRASMVKVNNI